MLMARSDASGRGCGQRLVDVPQDVVDVLEPDRDAHHVGQHAGRALLVLVELAVVVDAGWMTSVRVSPMFARWLMKRAASMKRTPASSPPRTPNASSPDAPGRPSTVRIWRATRACCGWSARPG